MILMQMNNITKRFGADLILSNIKLEVHTNDRIAIVGRNGAGKSTLLKIMAGELSYEEGELHKPKEATLGYLEQHTGLESDKSIWDEMIAVFDHLKAMEKQLRQMEEKMADPDLIAKEEQYQKLLKDYDELQLRFKNDGGYRYEADVKAVLNGLNFGDFDLTTPIATLSGGQKTRLALGKLLLSKPDILVLDEPTNHLDIDTLNWLEQYLQGYPGAVVIVSHDRYFLDKVVNVVYEISYRSSEKFHGNYSKYLDQKAANYERDLKQFEKQQSEMKRMEDFIQKNMARASTSKRAQSKQKQLEKMEKVDKPKGDQKSAKFTFDINRRSGNDVLKARDLSFQYEDSKKPVFENVSFDVNRTERLALVGPNGVGKTTLLKNIIDKLSPSGGTIQYGTNLQIGYYDQEQAQLNSSKTVLHELWDEYPFMDEKDVRTVLGNFLFTGDDVLKSVNSLSGGEKARIALAKLMLEKSNFLVLDEPTNHLDLDSKEVLESALMDYPGTILFVSHDRYFINRIATQILELDGTDTHLYLGDYDYYLEKKQEAKEIAEYEAQQNPTVQKETKDSKNQFEQNKAEQREARKRKRRIEEIEQEIVELEEVIEKNDALLCEPEVYQDHEKSLELTETNEQSQSKIESLMEEWEQLHEEN
ncbi:ABC-F family ATP-binding cassette domain-containing protein [Pontibacillus sp. ALD_SL1]|uniref:ABC-F family ATP-binding cassette domain-containing protein n=1 Tax=Pontibacillus sp. ALD_SL1 TaxID=2777185 RepID=UPI001A96FD44|nr:ABC-F family ATP-binding cassette domain-containing protein [Pontibacillus sp. ALD_SL1]QST00317.1 ABC-F family ATP-binding cassette domain-containing protein [Pontibacillus sp. ALD_SL1]